MELSVGRGRGAGFIAGSGALERPFVLVDIGARDGIHPRWIPFEPAMEVFGFDAIAEIAPPNARHHYFKLAVGDYDGECTFDVPDNLYEARISPAGHHKIPITKLDTLWDEKVLPPADFIKVDCEGSEPEVLRGAEQYLKASNILAADIETNFHISPTLPMSHFAAAALRSWSTACCSPNSPSAPRSNRCGPAHAMSCLPGTSSMNESTASLTRADHPSRSHRWTPSSRRSRFSTFMRSMAPPLRCCSSFAS